MDYRKVLAFEPKPFQREGIKFALSHHYCMIADEMGLGKTFQALALAALTGKKTLIIVPAYLRRTWKKEIDKCIKTWIDYALLEKRSDFHIPILDETVIVTSYSMLKECEDLMDWAEIVVADEANYLMNEKAIRTSEFHRLVYEYMPERLILLTGTPIKNRVGEYYSLLKLLSYTGKKTNGLSILNDFPTKTRFCNEFAFKRTFNLESGHTITKYSGLKNVHKLRKYLKNKVIRRYAKDHLDLQDPVFKDVYVDYDVSDFGMEEDWINFLENDSVDSRSKKLSAIAKAPFTTKYLVGLLEMGYGPIVVFSEHPDALEVIAKGLKNYKYRIIKGGTPPNLRHQYVEEFQNGDLDVILGTIGAASTGFTLTRANNLIFNDLSWVSGDNEQAWKRIHRIGQTELCVIHRILGSKQDEKIIKELTAKDKVLKGI